LTYAGNLENLKSVEKKLNYEFVQGDIGDSNLVADLLKKHQPRAIVNFAAETHVDRSIDNSYHFLKNNVISTYLLLEETRAFFNELNNKSKKKIPFFT